MRKPRYYEQTCVCGAYGFPHRFGGGRCQGISIVANQWHENFGGGDCEGCNLVNKQECAPYCEVLMGQEKTAECPVWQEHVRFNEIRIYK